MNDAVIAFIGGGNMAASLIGGLVSKGFSPDRIRASDPDEGSRSRLAQEFGIGTTADNGAACDGADVVVLAVKPQIMQTVARQLVPALSHRPAVISIAAGIPLAALHRCLGDEMPIVRCMPNTPALVQAGASALYPAPAVTDEQKALAESVLAAVGTVVWLDRESDIDAVTAVSGSGPAYYFLLMEVMEKTATDMGLSPAVARELTLQTALGAAKMAAAGDTDAAELRRRVCSPGGTTEKAIATLMDGQLPDLVARAMAAARQRAREMAVEMTQ